MSLDRELVSDRPSDWIPELHDIPIGLVNKILYQQDAEAEADIISHVIPKTHKTNTYTHTIIHNQYNTLTDTADEMSEEDALALRKSRPNGKRLSISTKKKS
jgi:hypothetical protein